MLRRRSDHRTGEKLTAQQAARAGLRYLARAEAGHRPTPAFFAIRGRCRQTLGEKEAARGDQELANRVPGAIALDHYLRGLAVFDKRSLAEGVEAFEAALRLEPTHYWSLMRLGYCFCEFGKTDEDFAGAARVFTGCILKRPEHAHAYYCRGLAY